MTGPDHFREAERIMTEMTFTQDGETRQLAFPEAMSMAQVHAILALAAATAQGGTVDARAWAVVAGTKAAGG
jgi:hypothetical protein